MKRQFAFVACLAALFAWAPAQAQELKFATQNPKGHPLAMGMEKFAEIVGAKSGGRLKVKLFPGGVLGGDQANVSALQGGTLEMVVLNSGILASQVSRSSASTTFRSCSPIRRRRTRWSTVPSAG